MKNALKKCLTVSVGLLLLAGCGASGTDANLDGDPTSVHLTMKATQGSGLDQGALIKALATGDTAGTAFNITSAWVHLGYVEVEVPGTCADVESSLPENGVCENENEDGGSESEVHIIDSFFVDLINGVFNPDVGELTIPSGVIHDVETKIEDVDQDAVLPEGVPQELAGNSLLVEGTTSINGSETPFSFRIHFDQEIQFANPEGVAISEGVSLNELVLGLDVTSWLEGLDLEACVNSGDVPLVDGVLLVTEENTTGDCSDIEDIIKDNVEASAHLEKEE